MTPLVRGDHVQPRRKTESHPANEWIREAHSPEIDVGIGPEKCPHVVLACKERRHGIGRAPVPFAAG